MLFDGLGFYLQCSSFPQNRCVNVIACTVVKEYYFLLFYAGFLVSTMNVAICRLFLVTWRTVGVHTTWQHATSAGGAKVICDSARL